MPGWHNVEAFARLDREIRRRLFGNEREKGLYHSLLNGDWETVCRVRGIIFGYEQVIEEMHRIAEAMTNAERQAEPPQPPRMN